MPAALAERAQTVLRCADGESNHAVAAHGATTPAQRTLLSGVIVLCRHVECVRP
jgi:hypothetical protein